MFLRELLRDHKQHMQDILSRDRQLGLEIEFEMRKMQNVEKPMSERVPAPDSNSRQPPLSLCVTTTVSPLMVICVVRSPATVS